MTDQATRLTLNETLGQHPNLLAGLRRLPAGCREFLVDHEDAVVTAKGSAFKHQAWPGGYLGHLDELFGLAAALYETLGGLRPLPFSLDDALLVLWLHDIEKTHKRLPDDVWRNPRYEELAADQHTLQAVVCADYDIELSPEQLVAVTYIHGEGSEHCPDRRVMNELGAFCHMCDVWSARGWFDEPRASGSLPGLVG